MDYPQLRPIEVFPIAVGGRDIIYLKDPTQLTHDAMFVPHETLFILAHCDGKHSILDIQEAYARQDGQLLSSEAVKGLIDKLDEHLRLDADFIQAIPEVASTRAEPLGYLVGGDVAHVGMKFGAQGPLTRAVLEQVAHENQALLHAVARLEAEGLFQGIAEHQDRRRICGFPPTYMLRSTIPATAGMVLKSDQAIEPATQSMVSYASVVFH